MSEENAELSPELEASDLDRFIQDYTSLPYDERTDSPVEQAIRFLYSPEKDVYEKMIKFTNELCNDVQIRESMLEKKEFLTALFSHFLDLDQEHTEHVLWILSKLIDRNPVNAHKLGAGCVHFLMQKLYQTDVPTRKYFLHIIGYFILNKDIALETGVGILAYFNNHFQIIHDGNYERDQKKFLETLWILASHDENFCTTILKSDYFKNEIKTKIKDNSSETLQKQRMYLLLQLMKHSDKNRQEMVKQELFTLTVEAVENAQPEALAYALRFLVEMCESGEVPEGEIRTCISVIVNTYIAEESCDLEYMASIIKTLRDLATNSLHASILVENRIIPETNDFLQEFGNQTNYGTYRELVEELMSLYDELLKGVQYDPAVIDTFDYVAIAAIANRSPKVAAFAINLLSHCKHAAKCFEMFAECPNDDIADYALLHTFLLLQSVDQRVQFANANKIEALKNEANQRQSFAYRTKILDVITSMFPLHMEEAMEEFPDDVRMASFAREVQGFAVSIDIPQMLQQTLNYQVGDLSRKYFYEWLITLRSH